MVLSKTAQRAMRVEEKEQMGVGQDGVCFDVEKEYDGEENGVIWPHRPKKQHGKKTDTGEYGRQAAKCKTCRELVI